MAGVAEEIWGKALRGVHVVAHDHVCAVHGVGNRAVEPGDGLRVELEHAVAVARLHFWVRAQDGCLGCIPLLQQFPGCVVAGLDQAQLRVNGSRSDFHLLDAFHPFARKHVLEVQELHNGPGVVMQRANVIHRVQVLEGVGDPHAHTFPCVHDEMRPDVLVVKRHPAQCYRDPVHDIQNVDGLQVVTDE